MPSLFWIIARLNFDFNKPTRRILGNAFAGEIITIGNDVKQCKRGEQVFGYTGEKIGAYAGYLCMSENDIFAAKPSNMFFEEASTVPYEAIMALSLLKKVNIHKGQKVLINGASGGIGSAAVQPAKHYFGTEVSGVCGTASIEFVKN